LLQKLRPRPFGNFARALRIALKQRLTIVLALICSLVVGVLWGANIGTVYPFVQVIFRGESLHEWVEGQIQGAQKNIRIHEEKVAELRAKKDGASAAAKQDLGRQLSYSQSCLQAEQEALQRATGLRPIIVAYFPESPFQVLIWLVIFVIIATVIRNLCMAANMLLVERVSQQTTMELRQQCFGHLLSLEMSALDKRHTGEMMSHFTDNMNTIGEGVKALLGTGIREPLKMATCLIGAAIISWQLLVLSMAFIPVVVVIIVVLTRSVKAANHRMMQQTGHMYKRLAETFTLFPLIKAFTLEDAEVGRFAAASHGLRQRAMRIVWFNSLSRSGAEVLGIAVVSLTLLMGGYLVLNQETHIFGVQISQRPMSAASLMLFYALLIGAHEPSRKLQGLFAVVNAATAASNRVFPLLDQKPTICSPLDPTPMPQHVRELTFKGVRFSYRENRQVLRGIDFTIRSGETLAIVGPSGCGKSTLASLILRFYDPNEGAVQLDGVDVRGFDLHELRRRMGLVTQQPLLFDDSIKDNIRCGEANATDEQIIEAAKKAHAHSFIQELENGYDDVPGERGQRLSGGQRQRISLARAILRDPAILILDEATSQIDNESERLIQLALRDFARDRITILITHRLSMLDLADRILVMQDGAIVGLGSHKQLLETCEAYRSLYVGEIRATAA